jgi:hypothetical protein
MMPSPSLAMDNDPNETLNKIASSTLRIKGNLWEKAEVMDKSSFNKLGYYKIFVILSTQRTLPLNVNPGHTTQGSNQVN